MKATGVVRRTDDLGRVAIPMEIRQCMKKVCLVFSFSYSEQRDIQDRQPVA